MSAFLDAGMSVPQQSLLATPMAAGGSLLLGGSHLLGASAAESALSVGDGIGGVSPQRRRRSSVLSKRSSVSNSIISPTIRAPVHLEEVASRIDDAAEGTLVDWPFAQPPVERRPNPLLNAEEMRNRYGLRLQQFGPEHDLSSGSSDMSKQHRKDRAKRTSPIRNDVKKKVTSNAQLVCEVQAAKKALRSRLREETLRNKLATQVKQWKDRVVDTAPTGLLASAASKFQYDVTVDPVYLHQEAMREVLVEESKIAEQLIILFQQMAREAEEMRQEREAEEAQEAHRHLLSMQTRLPSVSAAGSMDMLLNPCRPAQPRVPLYLRIEGGSRGCDRTTQAAGSGVASIRLGQSIANLDPAEDGRSFLPKLPNKSIPLQHPNHVRDHLPGSVQAKSPRRSRIVEEIIVEGDKKVDKAHEDGSRKTAPWATALVHLDTLSSGFESEPREAREHPQLNGSSHRAKLREDLRQVKYVPSSSSKVDHVVRTMVEASASTQQLGANGSLSKRRGTLAAAAGGGSMANLKAVRSRSVVALAAEALQSHNEATDEENVLRADSPDEIPEYWPDVHIPSDPNLRAVLHERIIEEAQRDCGLPCPAQLLCPIACELMSEPILVSNHIAGTFESSSGRSDGPTCDVLRVALERNTWENVIDGLQEGTLLSPKLPYPLNELLSRGIDDAKLHVRVDTEKLLALVTWRSTAMWMLANKMLDRREAFHVAASLVNTLVDSVFATSSLKANSLIGLPVSGDNTGGFEKRRNYPVNVMALRAAAHDANKKLQAVVVLMDKTRSATEKVVQGLHVLGIKRGCYERDLLRLMVRQQQQSGEATVGLMADMSTATEKLRLCDEEGHQQGQLLLDLERRFTSLKALRSTLAEQIDAYHEHVEAFNIFTCNERAHWGPVYKATISACYTVLTMLLNRELESTADTRVLFNKVAQCIGEPSARSMVAKLPLMVIAEERKMKQARLPLCPLALNDAAFVIMAPGGQFEDTLPFEPLAMIPYPSLRNEPALIAPSKTSAVATGAAMLKRKSLVPLPPSPRGVGQLRHSDKSHDPAPTSPKIVRPIGSDPKIPFWHFVRKGDIKNTVEGERSHGSEHHVTAVAQRPPDDPQSAPSLLGLRGSNTTPSVGRRVDQNARAAVFAAPTSQQFLAHKPLHAQFDQPNRGITVRRPIPQVGSGATDWMHPNPI